MRRATQRTFQPGDHICAVYSGTAELARIGADFLVQGLKNKERCWYVAAGTEGAAIIRALRRRRIDVNHEIRRGALDILDGSAAYVVHGEFNPERTVATFSDAIEAALKDGFNGFRAVAEMSWALAVKNGAQRVIAYEALLRSLFATSRAAGLCLYDRTRMPLNVLNGALVTHPIAGVNGRFKANPYYSANATELPASGADVPAKLRALSRPATRSRKH
jgi:two-component system, chemotaxis family, sensor kinase Cph1